MKILGEPYLRLDGLGERSSEMRDGDERSKKMKKEILIVAARVSRQTKETAVAESGN
jgi:hypothetical protein